MKTLKLLSVLALISIYFAACSPSKEKYETKINELEKNLFSEKNTSINKINAKELINAYIEFAEKFPADSNSAKYLFNAADISMNILESDKAISIYNKIINDYPSFKKAPECLFLKGFVYENNLHDLEKAKTIYLEFLEKYPDNDFADDAKISIENLGKTPEQLILEFEENTNNESKE